MTREIDPSIEVLGDLTLTDLVISMTKTALGEDTGDRRKSAETRALLTALRAHNELASNLLDQVIALRMENKQLLDENLNLKLAKHLDR